MHYQMSIFKAVIFMAIGAFAPISMANASSLKTLSYQDYIPLQRTQLRNQFVSFPLFNPDLGSLKSVLFSLAGEVEGSVKIENGDAATAFITASLGADVSVRYPDGRELLAVLPAASVSEKFLAGDGDLDFIGSSVKTFTGLRNTKTEQLILNDGFDFLIGLGDISLPVFGDGKSQATGAGNLLAGFQTFAGAKLKVVYEYEPLKRTITPEPIKKKVPEPSLSIAALTVVGMGLWLKNYRLAGKTENLVVNFRDRKPKLY